MQFFTLAVAVFVGLVSSTYGNSYRMGGCPRVVVMKSMDFDKFIGDWHVIQRFNPMVTCAKISISKEMEDQYAVNETGRPLGLHFGFHNQYLKPRKLKFLRNDTNTIFRLERNFAHFTQSTFGVVATDYDTYAIIWACDPVLFGSIQNVDVLSREPKPDEEVLKKIRDVLKDMTVDTHPLDNVDQSRCDFSSSESATGDKNTNNIVLDSA